MLNPNYNYICFDFETTGLDIKKDEPIQIGIVKFDHHFNILEKFQSLIKPKKNTKELKEIVQRVTGFKLKDLINANTPKEVFEQCKHFFTSKTIIIGHNIGFDLAILQRYIDFIPYQQIDTFPLSKIFFHFQTSYALDVLNKQLQKKGKGRSGSGSAHDALYDSLANMMLLKYYIEHITYLRHKYILLDYVFQESKGMLKDIIQIEKKQYYFKNKQLFLPPLKTYNKSNKKIITKEHIIFPKNKENKRYIGNISFKNLIKNINRTEKKYILTFTHKSKLTLTQQYLEKLDIPYNSLHDNIIFSQKLVNTFLQKKNFTDTEVLFIIKYFSQYNSGHNMIEINSLDNYKIFNAITILKPQSNKGVLLCTHKQLFQFSHKIKKNNTILFFDYERRYQNYSKWIKQAFDPLYLINLIDQLNYKYQIKGEKQLSKLSKQYLNSLSIFIGTLSIEINQIFSGYNNNEQEIDYILEHTRFPKTQNLFPKIKKNIKMFFKKIPEEDKILIDKQRQKLEKYLTGLCIIEKKMYNGDKWYYLLNDRNLYLSYEDFLKQIPSASYKFLSNSNKELTHLLIKEDIKHKKNQKRNIQLKTITDYKLLTQTLIKNITTQYIISSSKQKSQELFEELIKKNIYKKYTIVVENITGGIGKNIFLAKESKKPIIMIGGYNFYFEAIVKKIDFSILYIYYIYGNMKQQVIYDILYYI